MNPMQGLLAATVLCATTTFPTGATGVDPHAGLPADLRQAAADFDRAQLHSDAAELQRLLADDYVLYNSGGKVDSSAVASTEASSYSLTVGNKSAPHTVVIYEDFLCPYCDQLELASRDKLAQLAADGKVYLEYRPFRLLAPDYSGQALNAFAVVLKKSGPEVAKKFHDLLYANQPAENTAGLPDSTLVDYAKQAGAGDISQCVKDLTFEGWTARVTDQASKDGVVSTPTVMVAGKKIDNVLDPTAVKAAIEAALPK